MCYNSKDISGFPKLKHEKGEDTLLELSSLMTELRKIWAVIQKEDTEHIDPYGYDVRINH